MSGSRDSAQPANLKFPIKRGSYPYKDKATAMSTRDPEDLGSLKVGTPNVDLAKHHQIAWETLRECWNQSVDLFFTKDNISIDENFAVILQEMTALAERDDVWKIQMAPEEKAKLLAFLNNLTNGTIYHDEGDATHDSEMEIVAQMVCWCPANLIIGPAGKAANKAYRIDDPGIYFEKFLIVGMKNADVKNAILDAHPSAEELAKGNSGRAADYYRHYANLFTARVQYPQDVAENEWIKIPPSYWYLPGEWDTPKKKQSPPAKAWAQNTTNLPLRQAVARTDGPRAQKPTPRHGAVMPAYARDDASSITIDGQTINLEVMETTSNGTDAVYRSGSATRIRLGALLTYLNEKWPGLELPDFLRELTLKKLTVDTVDAGDLLHLWRFSVATETSLGDVPVSMVLYIEHLDDGFTVSALLGIKAPGADRPVHFSGVFDKGSNGWMFGGGLEIGTPLDLVDLAKTLGIDIGHIPDELKSLVPKVSEAGFLYRAGADELIAVTVETEDVEAALVLITSLGATRWAILGGPRVRTHLSGLPLVGGRVPPDADITVSGIGLAWASQGLTKEQVTEINKELAAISPTLPAFPAPPDGTAYSGTAPILVATIQSPGPRTLTLGLPL